MSKRKTESPLALSVDRTYNKDNILKVVVEGYVKLLKEQDPYYNSEKSFALWFI